MEGKYICWMLREIILVTTARKKMDICEREHTAKIYKE